MGVNDQVFVVLSTSALPSKALPLKIRNVSPLASGAETVPLILGVRSSVVPRWVTWPIALPKLSVMAVIAAVVVGVVLSLNFRAVDALPRLPTKSATRAVIE